MPGTQNQKLIRYLEDGYSLCRTGVLHAFRCTSPVCLDPIVEVAESPERADLLGPPGPGNLCSVSMDLPILDISYKWSHTNVTFCV